MNNRLNLYKSLFKEGGAKRIMEECIGDFFYIGKAWPVVKEDPAFLKELLDAGVGMYNPKKHGKPCNWVIPTSPVLKITKVQKNLNESAVTAAKFRGVKNTDKIGSIKYWIFPDEATAKAAENWLLMVESTIGVAEQEWLNQYKVNDQPEAGVWSLGSKTLTVRIECTAPELYYIDYTPAGANIVYKKMYNSPELEKGSFSGGHLHSHPLHLNLPPFIL